MRNNREYFIRLLSSSLACKPIYSANVKRTVSNDKGSSIVTHDFNMIIESVSGEKTVLGKFVEKDDFDEFKAEEYNGFREDLVFSIRPDGKVMYPNGNYDILYTDIEGLLGRIKGEYDEFRTENERIIESLYSQLSIAQKQVEELQEALRKEKNDHQFTKEIWIKKQKELENRLDIYDKKQRVDLEKELNRAYIKKILVEIKEIQLPNKKVRESSSNFGGTTVKSLVGITNQKFKYFLGYFNNNWMLRIVGIDYYERGPFDGPFHQEGWVGIYRFDERSARFVNHPVDDWSAIIIWKPIEELIDSAEKNIESLS